MKGSSKILFFITAVIIYQGCDSATRYDWEWKKHTDTFSIFMVRDTFKFWLDPHANIRNTVEPTIEISHDTLLTDSVRFILDIEIPTSGDSIYRSDLFPQWYGDTVWLGLDYDSFEISGGQTPQRTPRPPEIKISAIKVYLPPNADATFLGLAYF